MASCSCNGTLSNSGKPNCDSIPNLSLRQIVVPLTDSAGARNYVDPTAVINAAYINARLNDTDASQRWYPMPLMKNITDERGDAITEEFEDGSTEFIRQGTRTFTGMIVGSGPHYLNQLMDHRCVDFGVYEVDKDGALIGLSEADGFIYPIPVDKGSWYPRYVKKTDTAVAKIVVSYSYSQTADDESLEMVPSTDIIGIDLRTVNGLFDVHLVTTAGPTTTGMTAKITTNFGNVADRTTVKGLVAGDFTLAEITPTPGAIVITSVTETPANSGIYVFVWPAATSGDELRLTLTKTGYDASEISDGDHDITIP
jgi:hypothetical protein